MLRHYLQFFLDGTYSLNQLGTAVAHAVTSSMSKTLLVVGGAGFALSVLAGRIGCRCDFGGRPSNVRTLKSRGARLVKEWTQGIYVTNAAIIVPTNTATTFPGISLNMKAFTLTHR